MYLPTTSPYGYSSFLKEENRNSASNYIQNKAENLIQGILCLVKDVLKELISCVQLYLFLLRRLLF